MRRENGGDVEPAKLDPGVETVVELTRLDRVFWIQASVDEAIRGFGATAA